METVRFGKTGMKVSRLCLGCMTYGSTKWRDWVLDEEASRPFIREAIERGINFFDTADMYSVGASEEILGRALKEYAKRDEVVVATKVFNPMGPGPNAGGLSRKHVMEAIDASLKRLGMDYVDLYQIHRFDYDTPIEETVEALNDVVRAGKALYVGASSMWTWQFARMISVARERGLAEFASMQNYYNLVYREEEREMVPLCSDQGIGMIPWSPLARGFLAGNRTREKGGETTRSRSDEFAHRMYYQADDFTIVDRVKTVADAIGKTMPQVALAWMFSRPAVSAPIVGASRMTHLEQAVEALAVTLTPEQLRSLEEPYTPHPVMGH